MGRLLRREIPKKDDARSRSPAHAPRIRITLDCGSYMLRISDSQKKSNI